MVGLSRKTFIICKTVLFYLLFITMGSIIAIPGPTITSLQENLAKGETLDLLFVFRPLGYILGAILGGLLLDRIKIKEPVLITLSAAMGLFITGVGFCNRAWKVYIVMFFAGMALQSLNAGVNVAFLNMWGQVTGYYQALHFSFSVGALLAPLIAKPFVENITLSKKYPPSVAWAYTIVGCNSLFVTFLFLLFTICAWKETRKYKTYSITDDLAVEASVAHPIRLYTNLSLIFMLIAVFFQLSIEISYSQCIATYAITGYLQMSKERATYLTAAFWAPYMVSRFVIIFVTAYIKLSLIVCESCIILIISGLVLVCVGYKHAAAFWIGTILVGWGSGPLFPIMLSWFSRYIDMTFIIGSAFFAVGSFSEMIMPQILLINASTEPRLLGYWVLAASLLASLCYFLLWVIFEHIQDRYHRVTSSQPHPPPAAIYKLYVEDIDLGAMDEDLRKPSILKTSPSRNSPGETEKEDKSDNEHKKTVVNHQK